MKNTKTATTKTNVDSLLLERAKKLVASQMIGGVALVMIAVMTFNTMGFVSAVNSGSSNINMSVGGGNLTIPNTGADIQIAAATAGVTGLTEGDLDDLVISDYRDVDNFQYDVNIFSDPMIGVSDSGFSIPNTNIYAYSDDAGFTEVNTFTPTTKIQPSENGADLSGDNTFFNANNGRTGSVQIDDFNFGVYANADLDPQAYRGDITITVIAG